MDDYKLYYCNFNFYTFSIYIGVTGNYHCIGTVISEGKSTTVEFDVYRRPTDSEKSIRTINGGRINLDRFIGYECIPVRKNYGETDTINNKNGLLL